jgi:hypothetical protein
VCSTTIILPSSCGHASSRKKWLFLTRFKKLKIVQI